MDKEDYRTKQNNITVQNKKETVPPAYGRPQRVTSQRTNPAQVVAPQTWEDLEIGKGKTAIVDTTNDA